MKEILLTQDQVAFVDDEKFEELNKFKWYCRFDEGGKRKYAVRQIRQKEGCRLKNGKYVCPKQKTFRMHHAILLGKKGFIVDHRDGNGLNNCKGNLRYALNGQNIANGNTQRRSSKGHSSFRGVYMQASGKYYAAIRHNKKLIYLGQFSNATEAAAAYDIAALKYHKEFATLNFNNL